MQSAGPGAKPAAMRLEYHHRKIGESHPGWFRSGSPFFHRRVDARVAVPGFIVLGSARTLQRRTVLVHFRAGAVITARSAGPRDVEDAAEQPAFRPGFPNQLPYQFG